MGSRIHRFSFNATRVSALALSAGEKATRLVVFMALKYKWKRKRASATGEFAIGDLDNSSDDEYGAACPFDLSLRIEALTLDKQLWSVHARAIATSIRRGDVRHIMWWGPLASSTPVPLPHLRLSASTGVHSFQVDAVVCQNLLGFLQDGDSYNEDGFLLMAGAQWPGYATYPYVHAAHHHGKLQERKTVRVQGKSKVNLVLQKEPVVWALVQAVRSALGLARPREGGLQPAGKYIRGLHFLEQDKTQQASFSWHSDAEDIHVSAGAAQVDDMTTVIVQLSSDEKSAMRIWGFGHHVYDGQGSAVAFPGAALHESVPRRNVAGSRVWKVALFYC